MPEPVTSEISARTLFGDIDPDPTVLVPWAAECAERALRDALKLLPVWEWRYPTDPRARKALTAAGRVIEAVFTADQATATEAAHEAHRLMALVSGDYEPGPSARVTGPAPAFAWAVRCAVLASEALQATDPQAVLSLALRVASASAQTHAAQACALRWTELAVTRNGALTKRMNWARAALAARMGR